MIDKCPYCQKEEKQTMIDSFPFCSHCFQKFFGLTPKQFTTKTTKCRYCNNRPEYYCLCNFCISKYIFNNYDKEFAFIYPGGSKWWFKNGQYHRDNDQPAVISSGGSKYWYKNNQLHRDNDQPAIIYSDGLKEYWKNGQFIKEEK